MTKFVASGPGAGLPLSDVESVFYGAVNAAEIARQNALVGAHTAAAQRSANLAYHTAVVAARNTAIASGGGGHLGFASAQVIAAGEAGLT